MEDDKQHPIAEFAATLIVGLLAMMAVLLPIAGFFALIRIIAWLIAW